MGKLMPLWQDKKYLACLFMVLWVHMSFFSRDKIRKLTYVHKNLVKDIIDKSNMLVSLNLQQTGLDVQKIFLKICLTFYVYLCKSYFITIISKIIKETFLCRSRYLICMLYVNSNHTIINTLPSHHYTYNISAVAAMFLHAKITLYFSF